MSFLQLQKQPTKSSKETKKENDNFSYKNNSKNQNYDQDSYPKSKILNFNFSDFAIFDTDKFTQRKPMCKRGGKCEKWEANDLLKHITNIRPKLKISQKNDPLEKEANRVSEHIMTIPNMKINLSNRKINLYNENLQKSKKSSLNVNLYKSQEVIEEIKGVNFKNGKPLDSITKEFMESRFGYDFSKVRLHTDDKASRSAEVVNAIAYTVGNNIVFAKGQYLPQTTVGRRLLAHELTHVIQQLRTPFTSLYKTHISNHSFLSNLINNFTSGNSSRTNDIQIQRQAIEGGGATPGVGIGIDLIFIIKAEDDQYTADVTKYVKTVLKGQQYIEVDNLDDIFDYLDNYHRVRMFKSDPYNITQYTSPNPHPVRRIRIVSHGTPGGGIKMKIRSEDKRRFVYPKELENKYKTLKNIIIAGDVMTQNAVIEFWGCNIGNSPQAGQTLSGIFHSSFKAPTATFRTGHEEYFRLPMNRDERENKGEDVNVNGKIKRLVRVRDTHEIDKLGRNDREIFRRWLLAVYDRLVRNGDILPVEEQNRVNFMRDLFNRSDGQIKYIQIGNEGEKSVRPGDHERWNKLWKIFTI